MLVPTIVHALTHSPGVRALFNRDPALAPADPHLLLDGRLAVIGGAHLPSGIMFPRPDPDPEHLLAFLLVDDALDLSPEGPVAGTLAALPERLDLRVVLAAGAARGPDEVRTAMGALRSTSDVAVVPEYEIRRTLAAGLSPPLHAHIPDPMLEGIPSPDAVAELHAAACAGLHGEVAALLADGADPSHPIVEGGLGPAASAALAFRRILVHGTGPQSHGGADGILGAIGAIAAAGGVARVSDEEREVLIDCMLDSDSARLGAVLAAGGLDLGDDIAARAAARGHVLLAQALLEHGADPDARTADGLPLACHAVRLESVSLFDSLRRHGADLGAVRPSDGVGVGHLVMTASPVARNEIRSYLRRFTPREALPPWPGEAPRACAAAAEADCDGLDSLAAAGEVVPRDGPWRGAALEWALSRQSGKDDRFAASLRELGVPLRPNEVATAAARGAWGIVCTAVAHDPSYLAARDPEGTPLLCHAAARAPREVLAALARTPGAGRALDLAVDARGRTAVHHAVANPRPHQALVALDAAGGREGCDPGTDDLIRGYVHRVSPARDRFGRTAGETAALVAARPGAAVDALARRGHAAPAGDRTLHLVAANRDLREAVHAAQAADNAPASEFARRALEVPPGILAWTGDHALHVLLRVTGAERRLTVRARHAEALADFRASVGPTHPIEFRDLARIDENVRTEPAVTPSGAPRPTIDAAMRTFGATLAGGIRPPAAAGGLEGLEAARHEVMHRRNELGDTAFSLATAGGIEENAVAGLVREFGPASGRAADHGAAAAASIAEALRDSARGGHVEAIMALVESGAPLDVGPNGEGVAAYLARSDPGLDPPFALARRASAAGAFVEALRERDPALLASELEAQSGAGRTAAETLAAGGDPVSADIFSRGAALGPEESPCIGGGFGPWATGVAERALVRAAAHHDQSGMREHARAVETARPLDADPDPRLGWKLGLAAAYGLAPERADAEIFPFPVSAAGRAESHAEIAAARAAAIVSRRGAVSLGNGADPASFVRGPDTLPGHASLVRGAGPEALVGPLHDHLVEGRFDVALAIAREVPDVVSHPAVLGPVAKDVPRPVLFGERGPDGAPERRVFASAHLAHAMRISPDELVRGAERAPAKPRPDVGSGQARAGAPLSGFRSGPRKIARRGMDLDR